jgi:hypothetical protein
LHGEAFEESERQSIDWGFVLVSSVLQVSLHCFQFHAEPNSFRIELEAVREMMEMRENRNNGIGELE